MTSNCSSDLTTVSGQLGLDRDIDIDVSNDTLQSTTKATTASTTTLSRDPDTEFEWYYTYSDDRSLFTFKQLLCYIRQREHWQQCELERQQHEYQRQQSGCGRTCIGSSSRSKTRPATQFKPRVNVSELDRLRGHSRRRQSHSIPARGRRRHNHS
jgi:hypothetical protein